MHNLEIYCTSLQHFRVLDKLPSYIKPLGLGNYKYPKHWLDEKNGENILLNKGKKRGIQEKGVVFLPLELKKN